MAPKIIDEDSLKTREQEILDIAALLIIESGVTTLTMDKVVASVPYSKGTVYKHFSSKEDILIALSNKALDILSDLFWRASQYSGTTRERMLLLNFSYLIYAILYPALFQSVICAKSPNVYEKSSEKKIHEHDALEVKLMGAVHSIFEEAQKKKDLVFPKYMNVQQLGFANRVMGYGTIALLVGEVEKCTGRKSLVVERELFNQNNLLMDGLKWEPLTEDVDYRSKLYKALSDVFPTELQAMKKLGRVLDI